MPPNCHPCIDVGEHKSFGGLFHHPVEEKRNTKKGIMEKTCHVTKLEGLDASQDKVTHPQTP
jgi:hypothetical protein